MAQDAQTQVVPKTNGSAATRTPRRATIALAEALSKQELARFTSDTSVTDTVKNTISERSLPSSLSATSTLSSGTEAMVWDWQPQQFLEAGAPQLSPAELSKLSPSHLFKLQGIAQGRGEPIEETIRIALLWLQEMDAAVTTDGTLKDAVEFYLDNLCL